MKKFISGMVIGLLILFLNFTTAIYLTQNININFIMGMIYGSVGIVIWMKYNMI